MSLPEIARRLGICERTVRADYSNAVKKLQRVSGAFEIILDWIHASAAVELNIVQAGSAECQADFVRKWAQ